MFEEFWKNYHEINGIEPTDRMAAYREWKKLKLSEKQLAMENISTYFWRQSDIRHVKKAVNYLKDKSFIL